MSKPCSLNCYGNTKEDVINSLKENLPMNLLNFLLGLLNCANNNTLKNAFGNWNGLNIFAMQKLVDDINGVNNGGGRYDISDYNNIPDNIYNNLINEYNDLLCRGQGGGLIDIDNKYNGNGDGSYVRPLFPDGLTDADKNLIIDHLNNNNNGNDNINNGENNLVIVPPDYTDGGSGSGSGLTNDDIFGESGNPIYNIPNYEFDNGIDINKSVFKCFEPVFKLDNYIYSNSEKLFITPTKVANIKRVHNEILLPLYNFYYGNTTAPSCQIKVFFGIGSRSEINSVAAGSSFSRHSRGEAVDFTMVGIDYKKLLSDLKSGSLNLNFGILIPSNGIHMTLPYTYEGYTIQNTIISSPSKSANSLSIEYL